MENQKPVADTHENFKEGQGYASGEPGSEYQREHRSTKQFGDNPLPESGGGYEKAGEAQPPEDPDTPNGKPKQKKTAKTVHH